ncbi:MAG: hypothetical protein HYS20_01840 [Rhodocyclales bacterium]|nr:hypothetical protein [Rhodocyclales bacterium]
MVLQEHNATPPDAGRAWPATLATVVAAVMLAGCAGAMRQYDSELGNTMALAQGGQIDAALKKLDENNTGAEPDLLYHLEKGELLRMKGAIAESRDTWLRADETVRAWEDIAKTDPQRIFSEAGAYLVNDKTRRYDGQDYEKVLLSTRLALDHVLLGDWDLARIEVKKMHEREAVIAELRAKEIEDAQAKGEENNVTTTFKDLNGYPVELLEDPAVTELRNGYQSAVGHYVAGFVYEALGEPSLAAAGYRQAIELRPGITLLESGLADLERRGARPVPDMTDVLLIVEAGVAPAWKSISIPLPVPTSKGMIVISTSFPVIRAISEDVSLPVSRLAGAQVEVVPVTDIDVQARRALKDQMPGIVVRTVIRAIAKGALQAETQRHDKTGLLSLATMIASVVTEQADERSWRSLPSLIGIARLSLPHGTHTLQVGGGTHPITVGGRHALVMVKDLDGYVTVAQSPVPAAAEVFSEAVPAPVEAPPVAQTSKPVKKTKPAPTKKAKSSEKSQEKSMESAK